MSGTPAIPLSTYASTNPSPQAATDSSGSGAGSQLNSTGNILQGRQSNTSSVLTNRQGANSSGTVLPLANNSSTWKTRLAGVLTAANGIGTTALIMALVFGTGAWVGMKVQINQGAASLELAIWGTCADHEVNIVPTPTIDHYIYANYPNYSETEIHIA